MIADIGFMVGFYIITRMLSLIRNEKNTALRIIAGITIAVAAFCMLDLFIRGLTASTSISGI